MNKNFEEKLEHERLKFDQRERFDFEDLLRLSREVASQVETVDNSNSDFECSLKTFEKMQLAIMNEVMEITEKLYGVEMEFDLTVKRVSERMNEKLADTESKLSLMDMKSTSSDSYEDTPTDNEL